MPTQESIKGNNTSCPLRGQTLEHPLKLQENPVASDLYSSSIASCHELYAAKSLFIEQEQEALDLQNKSLTLADIGSKTKETLNSWKVKVRDFLRWNKSNKDVAVSSSKTAVGKQSKAQEAVPSQSLPNDMENKRIKEIEDTQATFEAALQKSGDGDMMINALMEMVCKIAILVGTLGHRYNKKEMKDYLDHLEINVKKRVTTFENGHKWTYITMGIQSVAVVMSFASVGGNFLVTPSTTGELIPTLAGKVLISFGNVSGSVSSVGSATSKLGDVENEQKTAKRTEYEHESQKLIQARTDMNQIIERIHQLMQELLNNLRTLNQTNTEAVKRTASA